MEQLKKLNILVVEDSDKHANGIVTSYQKVIARIMSEKQLKELLGFDEISVEWLKGKKPETKRNDEKFWFYDDSIYGEIDKKIEDNLKEGVRTGILLDVSLSREEYDKASVNDYSGFKIAREIYERFDKKAGIYIITAIREFSSQVLSLMGTKELIERHISKDLVTEYPSYGTIARTIRFMYDKKELEETEEDQFDSLLDEEI